MNTSTLNRAHIVLKTLIKNKKFKFIEKNKTNDNFLTCGVKKLHF